MEKNLNRKELAMENFLKGYNCTQSVLLAFEDLLPEENRKEIICMADLIINASALHDIGKIAIPDSILLKPGRLTKDGIKRQI